MYKACSRCGKIHESGFVCNVNRPKKHYSGGEERALRNTYAWHSKADEIKSQAWYLCEVCRAQGVYTYKGLEVHHIEKVKDQPEKLLDSANLVCLCVEHHKQADRGEISKDFLKNLAGVREGD